TGKPLLEVIGRAGTRRKQLTLCRPAAEKGLSPARVDGGEHTSRPALPQSAMGEQVQAADADEVERERLGEPARGGDADAQAGEGPRPHADGDALEGLPADPGL